eukprot:CAMPEP_0170277660 /NCGR_PEP_ID=MMETSP0116_2-20130129/38823_1 /TAXON_ID=400756 /ORGANISM="Durinskia baltica, Strain CSIRO CS-38" /LENGTH=431 /DNA_ID=CAMNT_0010528949 /DNA_START=56 /DNA_END=1346 /DNA_ORIENTATION=+
MAPAAAKKMMDEVPAAGVSPPPGLAFPSPAVCEVHLSGLPGKLLSPVMVEAILHQAALFDDVVVGYSITKKPRAGVTVSLSCELAAQRCPAHFRGCQWGESPESLVAEIVMLETPEALAARAAQWPGAALEEELAMLALQAEWGAAFLEEGDLPEEASPKPAAILSALSAEAPAWEPSPSRLTAAAPAFVPGAVHAPGFDVPTPSPQRAGRGLAVGAKGFVSETSTELGDSEDESPGGGASAALAAALRAISLRLDCMGPGGGGCDRDGAQCLHGPRGPPKAHPGPGRVPAHFSKPCAAPGRKKGIEPLGALCACTALARGLLWTFSAAPRRRIRAELGQSLAARVFRAIASGSMEPCCTARVSARLCTIARSECLASEPHAAGGGGGARDVLPPFLPPSEAAPCPPLALVDTTGRAGMRCGGLADSFAEK